MPKAEQGSVKDIAKQIKSKGLQKLKFYCQLCQKQCRDANGFKCHLTSESHLRQMKLFSENAHGMMDSYSREFEKSFLDTLRMRHSTTKVNANNVYQEVIRDRQHIHMNATIWATLTDFVQYLGRTGKCHVEETDRGWYVSYIERDMIKLARQEALIHQQQADLQAEQLVQEQMEYQRRQVAQQIASISGNTSTYQLIQPTNIERPSTVVKEEDGIMTNTTAESYTPLKVAIVSKKNKILGAKGAAGGVGRSIVQTSQPYPLLSSVFGPDDDDDNVNDDIDNTTTNINNQQPTGVTTTAAVLPSLKGSDQSTSMLQKQPIVELHTSLNKRTRETTNVHDPSKTLQRDDDDDATGNTNPTGMNGTTMHHNSSTSKKIKMNHIIQPEPWLYDGIIVRIINPTFANGKYFKQKAIIDKILPNNPYRAEVTTLLSSDRTKNHKDHPNTIRHDEDFHATSDDDGGGIVLQLDQDDLETVIPKKIGTMVRIVRGPYRGCKAIVHELNKLQSCAKLELSHSTKNQNHPSSESSSASSSLFLHQEDETNTSNTVFIQDVSYDDFAKL